MILFHYGVVGGLNTAVALAIFALMSEVLFQSAPYFFWIMVSHLMAVPFAYITQSKFVFRSELSVVRLGEFAFLATVGLLVNLVVFPALAFWLKWDDVPTQAISLIVVAVLGFVSRRLLVFAASPSEV